MRLRKTPAKRNSPEELGLPKAVAKKGGSGSRYRPASRVLTCLLLALPLWLTIILTHLGSGQSFSLEHWEARAGDCLWGTHPRPPFSLVHCIEGKVPAICVDPCGMCLPATLSPSTPATDFVSPFRPACPSLCLFLSLSFLGAVFKFQI